MKPELNRHTLEFKRIIEKKWYGPVFVNEEGDFYLDDNCKLDGFYQFSTETLDEIIHILTMIREFKENKEYEDV